MIRAYVPAQAAQEEPGPAEEAEDNDAAEAQWAAANAVEEADPYEEY